MPQLSVLQNAIAAQPGLAFDFETAPRDIVSAVAAVNIPFGTYCELNSSGLAVPLQDANLSGTVSVTNASASITFSTAQTLARGTAIQFGSQLGVIYYLAAAISAGTAGTLTVAYSGTTAGASTVALSPFTPGGAGSSRYEAGVGSFGTGLGICLFDPLGVEQSYVLWTVPAVLAGTVSVTNNSASITFSQNQTLPAGSQLTFASQQGVVYILQNAISAGTSGTLTTKYGGTTNASTTTTTWGGGSQAVGYLAGQVVPFMRSGRIWVAGDAGGTPTRTGVINVWHSSDGTHNQGVFTFSAISQTAGAEIDVAPGCQIWNPGLIQGTTGITYVDPFGVTFQVYPVEINI